MKVSPLLLVTFFSVSKERHFILPVDVRACYTSGFGCQKILGIKD